MKKILVLNGKSYGKAIKGLGDLVTDPKDFFRNTVDYSLVLFTGGEDVSPSLYGDTSPMRLCGSNAVRDAFEAKVLTQAQLHGIPCAGICRGIQFLNVMSGGRMVHHLVGHAGAFSMAATTVSPPIYINSYHHQMILPQVDAVIVAVSEETLSTIYIGDRDEPMDYCGEEIEAAIFPATKCFGVQWHPEMLKPDSDGYRFFYDMVDNALRLKWNQFVNLYNKELQNEDGTSERGLVVHGFA